MKTTSTQNIFSDRPRLPGVRCVLRKALSRSDLGLIDASTCTETRAHRVYRIPLVSFASSPVRGTFRNEVERSALVWRWLHQCFGGCRPHVSGPPHVRAVLIELTRWTGILGRDPHRACVRSSAAIRPVSQPHLNRRRAALPTSFPREKASQKGHFRETRHW